MSNDSSLKLRFPAAENLFLLSDNHWGRSEKSLMISSPIWAVWAELAQFSLSVNKYDKLGHDGKMWEAQSNLIPVRLSQGR